MFYRYEIRNQNEEEVLYLYLTMKYEFSKELIQKDDDLGRRTSNFIQNNHIPFRGKKVFLVVDDMIVKSIDLSQVPLFIDYHNYYSIDSFLVNIELDDQSISEITLRDYLLSVLLSKYMDNIHEEVLKAICILYNTYAYKMMMEEGKILSTNSFAIYKPATYYKSTLENYDVIVNKLQHIIEDVDCIFLRYQNDYILPFIHFSNIGKTFSNKKYPYLSSVKSLWDLTSPYYIEINDFSYEDMGKKLNILVTNDSIISIYNQDMNKKIMIDQHIFQLEEFKNIFQLKSTSFYIIFYQNFLRIITQGWGNGLGLSIFGANEIANNGGNYYQILKYYFPKTKIYLYAKKETS